MAKAIIAQDISKIFQITPYRNDSLRQNLQRVLRLSFRKKISFSALSDISFEVEEGEVFGIIGMNGSGKSTLLKILSKIMVPTRGRVELYGKINTLLEVGTGFHPELTGRENIFLNGSILGLSRSEIKSKFDAIVDFSAVEDFLETPVKHYSSGMFVRLAFAVAAHLDPDILIVDEVLSVGDVAFQQKCINKMEDEVLQGRTVLFVSHNMEQVQRLSKRVMLLHQGQVRDIGDPSNIIQKYLKHSQVHSNTDIQLGDQRQGNGVLRLLSIEILNASTEPCDVVVSGGYYHFRLHYQSDCNQLQLTNFRIIIKSAIGQVVLTFISQLCIPSIHSFPGKGYVDCILAKLPLNTGMYHVDIEIFHEYNLADKVISGITFEVERGAFYPSGDLPDSTVSVLADYSWQWSGDKIIP